MSNLRLKAIKSSGINVGSPEPMKLNNSVSIMKIRRNSSDTLPYVSGVSLGPHNSKISTSLVAPKPIRVMLDSSKNERNVVNKSVQVNSDDKCFLSQMKELQKENRQLQGSVKEKDEAMNNLIEVIQGKNDEYVKALEIERNNHETTKQQVKECQNLIEEKIQLLNDSTVYYETLMEDLQTQYQEAVETVKKHSQLEIRQRDDKLAKLKQQIADIFKEKSWEHQQQLEELKKELNRMTDETQMLRMKLKAENLPRQQCPNCRHLSSKLEEKALCMKLKERTIEELQAVCRRPTSIRDENKN
ncbi:interaptin-like isoform X2 [Rhinatrema bivittatum]|uniref:interaptin-like isoform X2 n=1 Tax=Rhinatrema bivittatum TaxID=194408 RepID=UPI0011279FFF|nr:interaptin-like isoform X2 [Rhinatrema bivittatum]XP_029449567.1 interaptin-like isoform X2 [Rhinatrema bivittatum]